MKTKYFLTLGLLTWAFWANGQTPITTRQGIVPVHNLRVEDTTYLGQIIGIWETDGGDTTVGFLPLFMLPDTTLKVGADTVVTSGNIGSYTASETDPTVPAYAKTLTGASVVLSGLLTVDGAGSNLDADLLDGQTGTYYTNLANHTGTLPVANGGTGLTALGSALQVLRVNAGGTSLEYATPTAGTVTSVGMTVPTGLSVSGSPVTSSGTFAVTNNLSAGIVKSAGVGGSFTSGTVSLSAEVGGTLPVGNGGTGLTALGSSLQVLRVNAGGTALEYATPTAGTVTSVGMTVPTGLSVSGSPVTSSGTFAVTNNLSAGIVKSAGVGGSFTSGTVSLSAEVGGTLPVGNGGTGLTALGSSLQVLRVNAGGTSLEYATPTAGTVTSVGMTVPTGLSVSGSPVTSSGTFAVTNNLSAGIVKSAGVGGSFTSGTVSLSAEVGGTLPVGNGGTGLTALGSALQVLRVNAGGTALEYATETDPTVPAYAKTLTGASVVLSGLLTVDGTGSGLDADLLDGQSSAAFGLVANPLSQFAATTSAQLAGVLTDETGSGGGFVRATSPTLTTPNLGTPSAVVLTNATGLPLSTGVTGTLPIANGGTNITTYTTGDLLYASATNTLSKRAAGTNGHVLTMVGGVPDWAAPAGGGGITVGTTTITSGTNTRILSNNSGVVGEYTVSGTGNVAMTTSPVFTTPNLGTPSAVTLTNGTGLPLSTGVTGVLNITNGGTGSSTAFTSGSVVFAGASGVYSQDNSGLFWDNTNKRLGVNTASPAANLSIVQPGGGLNAEFIRMTHSTSTFSIGKLGSTLAFGDITASKQRGFVIDFTTTPTKYFFGISTYTANPSSNYAYNFDAAGYAGALFSNAGINMTPSLSVFNGTFGTYAWDMGQQGSGTGTTPGSFVLRRSDSSGGDIFVFSGTGNLGINKTTPAEKLDVGGNGQFSGKIIVGDGTAGAPAMTFANETGTGFSRLSAGNMGVSVSGTVSGRWTTTGLNIGGAVTSPAWGLTVTGSTAGAKINSTSTSSFAALYFGETTSDATIPASIRRYGSTHSTFANVLALHTSGAHNIDLQVGGTTRVRATNTGAQITGTASVSGTGSTATSITGRDASNVLTNVALGNSLVLASGTLNANGTGWNNTATISTDTLITYAATNCVGYISCETDETVTITFRVLVATNSTGGSREITITPPIASNFTADETDIIGAVVTNPWASTNTNYAGNGFAYANTGSDKIVVRCRFPSGLTYPNNRWYVDGSVTYLKN